MKRDKNHRKHDDGSSKLDSHGTAPEPPLSEVTDSLGNDGEHGCGQRRSVMRMEQHDQHEPCDTDAALPNQQAHAAVAEQPGQRKQQQAQLGPQEKADRGFGPTNPGLADFLDATRLSNDLPPFIVIVIELGIWEVDRGPDFLPDELGNIEMALDIEDVGEEEGVSGATPVVVGIERQA